MPGGSAKVQSDQSWTLLDLCGEKSINFEYFSFLIIAVLFSAGNAKKNVFTVFIDPIVTIDGFFTGLITKLQRIQINPVAVESVYCDDRNCENCENVFFRISCAKQHCNVKKTERSFFFAFPALNITFKTDDDVRNLTQSVEVVLLES